MDKTALLQPHIRDRESLHEFFDALTDQIPNIERYVAQLKRAPRDKTLIADCSVPCTTSREMPRCARLIWGE